MGIGGITTESIKVAAQLCALGLDAMRFLETKDSFERNLMLILAKEVSEYKVIMDRNLAVEISNNVGKLFKA